MNELRVDDKWSIIFDPANNDRPLHWLRYGQYAKAWDGNNADLAMFYALLAVQGPY